MAAMRTAVVLCSLQCAAALQLTTTRRMNAASGAPTTRRMTATSATSAGATTDEWDAVVVGSGIGGLSCAAILANAGKRVLVCEAHDRAGGVAHDYEVQGFTFEAASATRRSDRVDGVRCPGHANDTTSFPQVRERSVPLRGPLAKREPKSIEARLPDHRRGARVADL